MTCHLCAVPRRNVAAKHWKLLTDDEIDVTAAAVDHRAGYASRLQRGDGQLSEVGGRLTVRLVDRYMARRDGTKHLERRSYRLVVVGGRPRLALHGVRGPARLMPWRSGLIVLGSVCWKRPALSRTSAIAPVQSIANRFASCARSVTCLD